MTLYKPYKDDGVHKLQNPVFFNIVNDSDNSYGFVWGCLNTARKFFPNEEFNGFLIKKHGFNIGNNQTAIRYFTNRSKFYNRYYGEIIILSNKIQPNAGRNDISFSLDFDSFNNCLNNIAESYSEIADKYQETNIAEEKLKKTSNVFHDYKTNQNANRQKLSLAIDDLKVKRLKQQKNKINNTVLIKIKAKVKEIEDYLKNEKSDDGAPSPHAGQSGNEGNGSSGANNGSGSNNGNNSGSQDTNGGEANNGSGQNNVSTSNSNRGINISQNVITILEEMNVNGDKSPPEARKLKQIYNSLCVVSIDKHPTLLEVGAWSFWEALAKVINPNETNSWSLLTQKRTDFVASFPKHQKKDIETALEFIQKHGDCCKHSPNSFTDIGKSQLNNKMEVLDGFLVEMLSLAKQSIDNR